MANKKEYFYFIDTHSTGEKIAIVEKATNTVSKNGQTSNYRTVQTAGTNILKIRGVFTEDDLVAGTLTGAFSNIPARFHSAIVDRVISMGYRDPRNFAADKATLFDSEWEHGLRKAKKFSKRNYISVGRIVPQDF